MSVDDIAGALDSLKADLREIEISLDFAIAASAVRTRLGGMLNWPVLDAATKRLAQEYMDFEGTYLDNILRGLYVSVASSYEQYVAEALVRGAGALAELAGSFDDLPEGLKRHNVYFTGRVFENIFGRRPYPKFDVYELSANIGTCVPGSAGFSLNSPLFSLEVTTPNADGLDRALERLAIKNYWDDVGRNSRVEKALGTSGVRETNREARAFLDAFVVRRNLIVHGERRATSIVESDVREALSVIAAVCEALQKIITSRLGSS